MREGPLAELFRATEAAQRSQPQDETPQPEAPAGERPDSIGEETQLIPPSDRQREVALEATVEHVYDFEAPQSQPPAPEPPLAAVPDPEPEPVTEVAAPVARAEPEPVAEARPEPFRPEPEEPPYQPPVSRLLQPMPGSAPRLEVVRAGDVASYLAV